MSQRQFGLTPDELSTVKAFNSSPDNPDPGTLTPNEIEDLESMHLTLGLMVKARRVLSLAEQVDKGTSRFVEKQMMNYYATRAEVRPLEESSEYCGQMLLAIFRVLRQKGIMSEDDLVQALRATAEGDIVWPTTAP